MDQSVDTDSCPAILKWDYTSGAVEISTATTCSHQAEWSFHKAGRTSSSIRKFSTRVTRAVKLQEVGDMYKFWRAGKEQFSQFIQV